MKRLVLPLLMLLCLTACGFHLRGMVNAPSWLQNVAILSHDKDQELVSQLRIRLESYKIHVNPDPAMASYWLNIKYVQFEDQVVGIGSSTNSRQYQMILKIGYLLQDKKGQIIQPERMVQVTRQFTENNNRILGSKDEQGILIREMRREAADQIINRLSKG